MECCQLHFELYNYEACDLTSNVQEWKVHHLSCYLMVEFLNKVDNMEISIDSLSISKKSVFEFLKSKILFNLNW